VRRPVAERKLIGTLYATMGRQLLTLALFASTVASLAAETWPHWRGPSRDGISTETNLPTTWSPTQNVAWKLPLPAFSGSTPIIWNDTIFLNVATERATGHIELWAVDRNKQAVAWKRPLSGENRIGNKQNMSSPSPVTDGKHVWVITGTGVLKGFDFAGKELWTREIQKDYGKFGIQFGYASSPLLHGDGLYLQVLHGMLTDDPSYVLKIDTMTGKTVWRVERPTDALQESPDSYAAPALLQYGGKTEIVITGGDVVTGHNPQTGKELWRADVLNPKKARNYRIISSPIIAGGLIIAPTRVNPLVALKPGGSGDVSGTHVAWTFHRGPDVPSPVSDGKYLYLVSEQGVVYCLELATGTLVYGPSRLPNDFYSSSPVLADGKIYVTGESTGVTTVFRAGPKFEILASNTFNDPCAPYCLASVAVSQGQLFVKTDANLWVVGERRK
jgi:outer membrane protein assembly factor BamB